MIVRGNLGHGRKGLSEDGAQYEAIPLSEQHLLEHVADDTIGLSGTSVVGSGAFTENLQGAKGGA